MFAPNCTCTCFKLVMVKRNLAFMFSNSVDCNVRIHMLRLFNLSGFSLRFLWFVYVSCQKKAPRAISRGGGAWDLPTPVSRLLLLSALSKRNPPAYLSRPFLGIPRR